MYTGTPAFRAFYLCSMALLLATDREAMALTASASSESPCLASSSDSPSREELRCTQRQYLPEIRVEASLQMEEKKKKPSVASILTVSLQNLLQGADGVGIGPLLQDGLGQWIQLQEMKTQTERMSTQAVTLISSTNTGQVLMASDEACVRKENVLFFFLQKIEI